MGPFFALERVGIKWTKNDARTYSFPDKILENRYPTHFPISGNRGFWRKAGLKGWGGGGALGVHSSVEEWLVQGVGQDDV
jgi:hypothetical protein